MIFKRLLPALALLASSVENTDAVPQMLRELAPGGGGSNSVKACIFNTTEFIDLTGVYYMGSNDFEAEASVDLGVLKNPNGWSQIIEVFMVNAIIIFNYTPCDGGFTASLASTVVEIELQRVGSSDDPFSAEPGKVHFETQLLVDGTSEPNFNLDLTAGARGYKFIAPQLAAGDYNVKAKFYVKGFYAASYSFGGLGIIRGKTVITTEAAKVDLPDDGLCVWEEAVSTTTTMMPYSTETTPP